ncbi:MAG: alpha/beta fold hydrolase [Syntrophobacter sp.]
MKFLVRTILCLIFVSAMAGTACAQSPLMFSELGDFRLENQQVIKDCKLGYRIFGEPDADKTNVVVFPTWFAGTTQELVDTGMIGPGKLIDTSRLYVIAIESFGNGVSSSPSNSTTQSGPSFPEFTIRDMVNAEHRFLTRDLHLERAYAVVGISMGGMQAFQWMVSYPGFFQKAVSIVGTPRLATSDLLLLQAEIEAIEAGRNCGNARLGMKTISAVHTFALYTPSYLSAHASPGDFPAYLAKIEKGLERFNPDDWEWQLKALMTHDIFRAFGGSREKAASAIQTKTLVIMSARDQLVNPEPSTAFSRLIKAEFAELSSDCGHIMFLCEKEKLRERVMSFLTR